LWIRVEAVKRVGSLSDPLTDWKSLPGRNTLPPGRIRNLWKNSVMNTGPRTYPKIKVGLWWCV
jgi:hypothetical protein